jgi:hypothetical protein
MAKFFNYILTHPRSGDTITLTKSPADWEKKSLTFSFNKTYKSVFRSFSLPLRFVKEGKTFIDDIWNEYGIEEKITVEITEQNPTSLVYDIEFYTGILDLSTYEWDIDFTEVTFIDGSIEAAFIGNEKIEFDLNSTTAYDGTSITPFVSQPFNFQLTPIDLYRYARTICQRSVSLSKTTDPTTQDVINVRNDGILMNDLGESIVDLSEKIYTNDHGSSLDVNIIFDYATLGSFVFGNISPFGTVDYRIDIQRYNSSDSPQGGAINIFDITETGTNETIVINETGSYDDTITFADGDYIRYIITVDTTSAGQDYININCTNTFKPHTIIEELPAPVVSTSESFLFFEAFTRLIQLSTAQTTTTKLLDSNILGRTNL